MIIFLPLAGGGLLGLGLGAGPLPILGNLLVHLVYGVTLGFLYPAFRYLGMLATTLGHFGDAETHFHEALAGCERLESPLWTAHTRYQFARMLLTRRRPGDVAQAERLARVAQETAAALGMRALEGRAGRLLESGLDVAP